MAGLETVLVKSVGFRVNLEKIVANFCVKEEVLSILTDRPERELLLVPFPITIYNNDSS